HRGDLARRELLIYDPDELLGQSNFEGLMAAIGIDVHSVYESEMKNKTERVVNFRSAFGHAGDQHGIYLHRQDPTGEADVIAAYYALHRYDWGWTGGRGPGPSIECIVHVGQITYDLAMDTPPGGVPWLGRAIQQVVLNELGHGIGMNEHGQGWWPMTGELGCAMRDIWD